MLSDEELEAIRARLKADENAESCILIEHCHEDIASLLAEVERLRALVLTLNDRIAMLYDEAEE